MRSLTAFREGLRRVHNAWILVFGMTAATIVIAVPLSVTLRSLIREHVGASLLAQSGGTDISYEWWQEFQAQASGVGRTFQPSIVGFGAVLENVSGLLDNAALAAPLLGVTAIWLLTWSFLSGGVLDRLARGRRTRAYGFFGACGVHFWRFLRIGLVALLAYYLLFAWLHGWIFERMVARLTDDLTVERTAFFVRLGGYGVFGGVLVLFSLVFDYARIRTVVGDRRSALGSIVSAIRFVRRHPGRVTALYLLNSVAFLALVALYALVSVSVESPASSAWLVVLTGQSYILARHYLKLVFYASETALFEGTLAHARFTADPPRLWPDSPAGERIANAGVAALR